MARIKLNSNFFHLPEGQSIQSYAVDPQAEAFSTAGASRRIDNKKLRRFVNGWSDGIGIARKKREQGQGINGLRDADAETRFDHASLPYLRVAGSGETGHFRKFFHYNGDLYVATEDDYVSDAETQARVWKWDTSGTNWSVVAVMGAAAHGTNAEGCRHWDIIPYKGQIFSVTTGADPDNDGGSESTERRYALTRTSQADFSTVLSIMNSLGTAGDSHNTTTTVSRRNNYDDHHARVVAFGDNLIIAVWNGAGAAEAAINDGIIRVIKTSNAPTTAADGAATIATVADIPTVSTDGAGADPIRGMDVWRDPYSAGVPAAPIVSTEENIYVLDVANNSYNPLFPSNFLTAGPADGRMAVGSNGNLYFTRGENILEASIVGLGQVNIRNVGPSTRTILPNTSQDPAASLSGHGDGLISSKQGVPTFVYGGSPDWLYVAYGGTTSGKKKSILAMDYNTKAWHSVYYDDGTTFNDDGDARIWGMILSSEDDGVQRLHWFQEGASLTPGANSVHFYIDEPERPPRQRVESTDDGFKAAGYIEFAEDDHGDPQTSTALLESRVDADDLGGSTSADYMEHKYGLDGEAWDANDLGDFFSGTKTLSFGTSGRGVSAKTARHRLNFAIDAGDATQTPILNEFEVVVRTKLATLKGFRVPIDIGRTAAEEGIRPQDVIDRLEAIHDSVTLVPFSRDPDTGFTSEVQVELTSLQLQTTEGGSATAFNAQSSRGGIAVVSIEEVL
jgi:hypothetical protein